MRDGIEENHAIPAWLTPRRILALFCVMNMFIYIDRGIIASNGVNGAAATEDEPGYGIVGTFDLTLFQDGLLPAAFMVGLLAASPVFAEASHHYSALRLIGVGLALWAVAAVGCGLSVGFWSLLICRMAVGVGEASFVALAAPFIDDAAPPERKTRWLAAFYLCIPAGIAAGYVAGGMLAAALGWRAPFLLEALAMLPFIVLCHAVPPIYLRGTGVDPGPHDDGDGVGDSGERKRGDGAGVRRSRLQQARHDLRTLCTLPVYVLVVAGMTGMTSVLGTFAYYGPKAGRELFGISPQRADLSFGAVTVATGIVGTLAGGMVLDRAGSSIRNALLLCSAGLAAGGALLVAAFAVARTFEAFMAVVALGQLGVFVSQAPSNAAILWSVPAGLRPVAMSLSVVSIHLLGDVPSPPLLGLLQQAVSNWRLSMGLWTCLLGAAAAAYAAALLPARHARDYREEGPREHAGGDGAGHAAGDGLAPHALHAHQPLLRVEEPASARA